MTASDYRSRAREALRGNWVNAVLVCFVASLLGGSGLNASNLSVKADEYLSSMDHLLSREMLLMLATIVGAAATVGTVISLIHFLLSGVTAMGSARYHLHLADRNQASFEDLFSQFHRFGDGLLANLLTTLFTALWSLLFVIPGIIAAYRYSMVYYIMLENPECSAMEAINRSKELMNGHKMDLFLLDLSFIGWQLLCGLTLGLGQLVLNPYIETSHAVFYRNLTQSKQENSADNPYSQWNA